MPRRVGQTPAGPACPTGRVQVTKCAFWPRASRLDGPWLHAPLGKSALPRLRGHCALQDRAPKDRVPNSRQTSRPPSLAGPCNCRPRRHYIDRDPIARPSCIAFFDAQAPPQPFMIQTYNAFIPMLLKRSTPPPPLSPSPLSLPLPSPLVSSLFPTPSGFPPSVRFLALGERLFNSGYFQETVGVSVTSFWTSISPPSET